VTPILVRPVREQLEHDRVIRLLQARWRRKYTVTANQGAEQNASVPSGDAVIYPDLVLISTTTHKPEVIVEVETAESVNNLEAMAQWVRMGRLKTAFHLYVPSGSVDAARRLCTEHEIPVAEICTYHALGEQMRFVTVYKAPPRPERRRRAAAPAAAASRRRVAEGARKTTTARRRTTSSASPKKTTARSARAPKRR
jgi:hypothetical protein